MGCTQSSSVPAGTDESGASTGASPSKQPLRRQGSDGAAEGKEKEEALELSLRTKRRGQNVFTESVEITQGYAPPVIPKSNQSKTAIRGALEANFIFASLSPDEVVSLIDAMEECPVVRGEAIITQGDGGDYFYVVETGSFEYIVNGAPVGQCNAGGSFGELALLYNTPRQATVKALEDSLVWRLDRVTFRFTLANSAAEQKSDISQTLRRVPLLEGLTDAQLAKIADAVQIIRYNAGDVVIEKGTEGNILYLIKEGTVRVSNVGDGSKFADRSYGPGEYFGERALLTGEPRAADVTAEDQGCCLLALDREAFNSLLGPLHELLDFNLNLRVLNSIKLFEKLTDQEKDRIANAFELQTYEPGQAIVRQGDAGNTFYVLKTGAARVLVRESPQAADVEVNVIHQGDHFGEAALLNAEPRNATVEAIERTEVFVLDRATFTRILGPLQEVLDRQVASREEQAAEKLNAASRVDIDFNDLQELAILGTGTFGRVKLVEHRETKQVYALKTMLKSEIVAHKQEKNVVNEKNIMIQSDHPFILRLHTTYKDSRKLYLLLEFVQGGELFSVLHTPTTDGVPNSSACFYGAGVINGLAYLHQSDIAYRDLKPENCLIDSEGYPKIVDFGFAKVIHGKTYTLCGTPEYLAPEIVLGRGHNKGVDYWAFGILLYEMLAGYSPFSDPQSMDQVVICRNIVNGKLGFPRDFNPDCKDLVKRLLVRDPAHRLGNLRGGADDIMRHRWFSEIDFDALLSRTIEAPWKPNIGSITDTSNFDPYDVEEEYDDGYVDNGDWDRDF